jgi:hypothetical protein
MTTESNPFDQAEEPGSVFDEGTEQQSEVFDDFEDDLSGVETGPGMPKDDGWYKVNCEFISTKPSKGGDTKRSAKLVFPNGYAHWDNYNIGMQGQAGTISRSNYKKLAIACGIQPQYDDQGKEDFKFKPGDLHGSTIYIRIAIREKKADGSPDNFPLKIYDYRSPENMPDDFEEKEQQVEGGDDGLPF